MRASIPAVVVPPTVVDDDRCRIDASTLNANRSTSDIALASLSGARSNTRSSVHTYTTTTNTTPRKENTNKHITVIVVVVVVIVVVASSSSSRRVGTAIARALNPHDPSTHLARREGLLKHPIAGAVRAPWSPPRGRRHPSGVCTSPSSIRGARPAPP